MKLIKIKLNKFWLKRGLIVLLSLFVLAALGLAGNAKLQAMQADQAEQELRFEEILSTQRQDLEQSKQALSTLSRQTRNALFQTQDRLAFELNQRRAVEEQLRMRSQAAQQRIAALENQLSQVESSDLSNIIRSWQPIIAYIKCTYSHSAAMGSGIALSFGANAPVMILTNKHVVTDSQGLAARDCSIKLPGSPQTAHSQNVHIETSGLDLGYLRIDKPNQILRQRTTSFPRLCTQHPVLGDSVVILGYPGIGARDSLTATEGIISGFEPNYFITSAKVEHGNSGGAAILAKDNCLLGIPTFAAVGSVESLARILDISTLYN